MLAYLSAQRTRWTVQKKVSACLRASQRPSQSSWEGSDFFEKCYDDLNKENSSDEPFRVSSQGLEDGVGVPYCLAHLQPASPSRCA